MPVGERASGLFSLAVTFRLCYQLVIRDELFLLVDFHFQILLFTPK